jgi:hypothetical protein
VTLALFATFPIPLLRNILPNIVNGDLVEVFPPVKIQAQGAKVDAVSYFHAGCRETLGLTYLTVLNPSWWNKSQHRSLYKETSNMHNTATASQWPQSIASEFAQVEESRN